MTDIRDNTPVSEKKTGVSKKSSKINRRKFKKKMTPYVFIMPNLIIFLTFSIIPICMNVYYSFTRYNGLDEPKFIGFDNYIRLLSDDYFIMAFKETLILVAILVPITFVVSLTLAMIMTRNIKAKGLFRTSFYWPVMVSAIVIGIIWQWLFSDSVGLLNGVRRAMGMAPIATLTNPTFARMIVVFSIMWSQAGYYMVIFIGGIQSIPETLYQAAKIDGANKVQEFFKITLPLLKPTSIMVFILFTMQAFKTYASVVSLTAGGPYKATTYIIQHIYETAFDKNYFGYASSMSVVMMVFVVIISLTVYSRNNGGEY